MLLSKVSSKGQVTIPKQVREAIGIEYGDIVAYEIKDGVVTLKRGDAFDAAYYAAISKTLTEWTSPEDEEAFSDLML